MWEKWEAVSSLSPYISGSSPLKSRSIIGAVVGFVYWDVFLWTWWPKYIIPYSTLTHVLLTCLSKVLNGFAPLNHSPIQSFKYLLWTSTFLGARIQGLNKLHYLPSSSLHRSGKMSVYEQQLNNRMITIMENRLSEEDRKTLIWKLMNGCIRSVP